MRCRRGEKPVRRIALVAVLCAGAAMCSAAEPLLIARTQRGDERLEINASAWGEATLRVGALIGMDGPARVRWRGVIEGVRVESDRRVALWGRLVSPEPGQFALVRRGGAVAASLRPASGGLGRVLPMSGGGLRAEWVPPGSAPEAGACRTLVPPPLPGGPAEGGTAGQGAAVFDLLAAYTPKTRDDLGGLDGVEAMIELTVVETNQAYANSLIDAELRLVGMMEVAFDEDANSGDFEGYLVALTDDTDGVMDEVHCVRDAVGADQVTLFVSVPGAGICGIAWVMTELSEAFAPYAFSVINATSACRDVGLVVAHELGHNQGCMHDREHSGFEGVFPFSFAHEFVGDSGVRRTTVMYWSAARSILWFSNPDVLFDGVPTGVPVEDPDAAHNALSINLVAATVSAWRPAAEVPFADCNVNGVPDDCEVAFGLAGDCDANGVPDECQADCDGNGLADACDVLEGRQDDCDGNLVPDECEFVDCNGNGQLDACDLLDQTSADCDANGVPDECDVGVGTAPDCNANGVPDGCDVQAGTSPDCNANGVPDECDLAAGTVADCNANGVPDVCDLAAGDATDCNGNGVPDACDLASGASADCDADSVPDECALAAGTGEDCNANGLLDACEVEAAVLLEPWGVPTVGEPVSALGAADVNGDGLADLLVGTSGGRLIRLINEGAGAFVPDGEALVGGAVRALAVADMNGDGWADVAAVDAASDAITVVLSNGAVWPGEQRTVPVGASLQDVVAADFDGDGRIDLAVAAGASDHVHVRFNDAGVTMGTGVSLRAGARPQALVVVDPDADGDEDIVVANSLGNSIGVLENVGGRVFREGPALAAGLFPTVVAAGDVTGDGLVDLVAAGPLSRAARIFTGRASVLPAAAPGVTLPAPVVALHLADITGRGRSDMVVVEEASGALVVLVNRADGFVERARLGGVRGGRHLAVADFNGDGRDDYALGSAMEAEVHVWVDRSVPALGEDCNGNGVPDACDLSRGASGDCDADGRPDECQPDVDGDGVIDACDNCPQVANEAQADADGDGTGDACEPVAPAGVNQPDGGGGPATEPAPPAAPPAGEVSPPLLPFPVCGLGGASAAAMSLLLLPGVRPRRRCGG